MTDFTVTATITVSADPGDRQKIQDGVDAGLKELPGLASRYGFTVTDATATVDTAG